MMKGKKHLTAQTTAHMTDEEIDQYLLDLLPMTRSEIYGQFGADWSAARRTKKRIRTRLNALMDEGMIYATGRVSGLTYHKRKKHQESI